MSCAPENPTLREPPQFSMRLPRPLWIGAAAVVLIVVAFCLRIGVKAYRQNVVTREFDRLHVRYDTRPSGPQWLQGILLRCGCSPELLPQEICSVQVGYHVSPDDFS